MRIYTVRYEWDEAKNLRNQRKHGGVSFELATMVFEDEKCLIVPDRVDEAAGEQRWHALGEVHLGRSGAVILVVHVYREKNQDGKESIRILSARPATKPELRRYQEQGLD